MNALLARLWQRAQQPGCTQRAMGPDIAARHLRNATAPPLASLLLRRTHTTDYTAPDPPVIVTASPAGPAPPLPAARRSPTVRARPVPRNGATLPTPHPAAPTASPVSDARIGRGPVAGRTAIGTSGAAGASGAIGTSGAAGASRTRGPGGATDFSGARISGGARDSSGTAGYGGAGAVDDAGTVYRAETVHRAATGDGARAGAGTVDGYGAEAISGAGPVSARPAQRPVVAPNGERTGPPPGQTRTYPAPEGSAAGTVRTAVAPGRDRPVVTARHAIDTERPVVRAHEAGSRDRGAATRPLPERTAPAVPQETDRAEPAKQDDPGRRDREKHSRRG